MLGVGLRSGPLFGAWSTSVRAFLCVAWFGLRVCVLVPVYHVSGCFEHTPQTPPRPCGSSNDLAACRAAVQGVAYVCATGLICAKLARRFEAACGDNCQHAIEATRGECLPPWRGLATGGGAGQWPVVRVGSQLGQGLLCPESIWTVSKVCFMPVCRFL